MDGVRAAAALRAEPGRGIRRIRRGMAAGAARSGRSAVGVGAAATATFRDGDRVARGRPGLAAARRLRAVGLRAAGPRGDRMSSVAQPRRALTREGWAALASAPSPPLLA